jgi:hypothetical protein
MLDYIINLFKKEQPKQQVRVCNTCGFIWQSEDDPARETGSVLGPGLCPDCHGMDTQVATDWHREHRDLIKERREHYLEATGRKEKIRKSA